MLAGRTAAERVESSRSRENAITASSPSVPYALQQEAALATGGEILEGGSRIGGDGGASVAFRGRDDESEVSDDFGSW